MRITFPVLLLAGLFVGPPATAEEATLDFDALRLRPKVHKELADCRSLTVPHETHVELGTPWTAIGHVFEFAVRSNGRFSVTIQEEGEEDRSRKVLGDEPGVFSVEAFGLDYGLAWRPGRDGQGVWVASAYGAEIDVGDGEAYIVDSNRNGKLGELAQDGLVAPQSRTVGPWAGEVWSREEAFVVRTTGDGEFESAPYVMPYPENEDHGAAFRLLNWRRQQCGALAVQYLKPLEPAMKLHALYCAVNRYRGHEEDPEKKGYHEAGAEAGLQCVLGFEGTSALEAMDLQLRTLFRRNQMLSPALSRTAIVFEFGVFAVNVKRFADGPLERSVLVYPPHGMQEAPVRFAESGERPMPTKNQPKLQQLGTPIGLYAKAMESMATLAERPTLRVSQMDRDDVEKTYMRGYRYPGRVSHDDVPKHNFGNIALVPSRPLETRTTYRCLVELQLPEGAFATTPPTKEGLFSYEWEFETAR